MPHKSSYGGKKSGPMKKMGKMMPKSSKSHGPKPKPKPGYAGGGYGRK